MQRLGMAKGFRTRALLVCFVALSASTASTASAQIVSGKLAPGVIASQGGAEVSLQDIDAYAAKIPERDRGAFFNNPKRIENVIMDLLLQRQLANEARAANLDKDAAVQRQILLSTEDTLARVDLDNYRKSLKLPNFDELAHEYYLTHKTEFMTTGNVTVKHILVSTKDRSVADAKARIAEVEATVRAHPEQFDSMIQKYSDDPSKVDNLGVIKNASSGKMAGPFTKAAQALKTPGEISPVVKTVFGFHLLELVDSQPAKQLAYEEVSPMLVDKIRKEWVEKQVSDHSGQMRGKTMDASPDLVASLRDRYMAPDTVTPEQAGERAAREAAAKKAAEKESEAKH